MLAAVGLGLVVVLWWLLFSRAPWSDRVGAIVLMVAALFATSRVVHASIAGGMMGFMLVMYAIPALSLALVAGVVAGRRLSARARRATMAGAILIACGAFTLLRTGGLTAGGAADMHWRWTPTPRSGSCCRPKTNGCLLSRRRPRRRPRPLRRRRLRRLLVQRSRPHHRSHRRRSLSGPAFAAQSATASSAVCGLDRLVRVAARNALAAADWPGCSSFAIRGDLFYTQEQLGDAEMSPATG